MLNQSTQARVAIRPASAFAARRHDVHLSDRPERDCERLNTGGLDAVIVGQHYVVRVGLAAGSPAEGRGHHDCEAHAGQDSGVLGVHGFLH